METGQTVQPITDPPATPTTAAETVSLPGPEPLNERKPPRRPTGKPPGRPRKDGRPAGSVRPLSQEPGAASPSEGTRVVPASAPALPATSNDAPAAPGPSLAPDVSVLRRRG